MAKQSESSLTGLLEIPILTSRTGPMKRLVADLHEVSRQLDQARNAIVRAWLRWHEDHPDWKPPVAVDDKGKPKSRRNGEPILISPMHPIRVDRQGGPAEEESEDSTGFSTYLYHAGRKAAPNVAATLISTAAKEVVSNLGTDIQYHSGEYKFRWQAVLANDEQSPSFKMRNIPVPNNSAIFCYAGRSTGGGSSPALVEFWGKSGAVLSFSLFAATSGRKVRSPIVTLNVGALSPGNRKVLAQVARGEWKFSDSKIVFKKDKWIFQLTYRQPGVDLGLDKSHVAYLFPQFAESQRPFLLDIPDGNRHWQCGNGLWLAAEFERLEKRRKELRGRYKVSLSGVKGHGRKRFEMRLKPWSRKTHDCQRHFTWQLIAEIVRFCKANNCGSVVYREPSLGIREHLWLGKRDIPYDWTSLATDLAYKLRYYGIEVVIDRIGGKDLREWLGAKKSTVANSTQPINGNGHAAKGGIPAARVSKMIASKGDTKANGKSSRFAGAKKA